MAFKTPQKAVILAVSVILFIISTVITLLLNKGDFTGTNLLPFDLTDQTIQYPEIPDTINGVVNVVVNSVISMLAMAIWLWINRNKMQSREMLVQISVIALFTVMYGGILVNLFTNVFKHYRGGLRPHFIAACHPNQTLLDLLAAEDKTWVDLEMTKIICTNEDKPEYRWSFPSGHSSEAFYGMVITALIINQYPWDTTLLPIKSTLQFCCLTFASWVTCSRVVDYHHHWWDVPAGALLGTLFAIVAHAWCLQQIYDAVEKVGIKESPGLVQEGFDGSRM